MKIHFSRQESEVRKTTKELMVLRSLIDIQNPRENNESGFHLEESLKANL